MSDLTYLNLVNTVLAEAKITLDPLTAANFLDPPRTAMYKNVQRWVNEAMRELLTTRNEWFTRKERTLVEIYPRVQLADAIVPPIVGYHYRGKTSGVEFVVKAIHETKIQEGSNYTEATVSIEFIDNEFQLSDFATGELLDVINPAPTMDAAVYKASGFYDLKALPGNAELIDARSITFQPTIDDYEDGASWNNNPATLVSWRDFRDVRFGYKMTTDVGPMFVTQTPMGSYAFWPELSKKVLISYDYTRAIQDMVAWDDVPVGIPDKYQMWIVWRAVQEYGDFQQSGQIWSRGNKNAEKFMLLMDRDNAPEVTLTGWEG